MNAIKDKEWEGGRDRDKQRRDEEKPAQLKYHKYTLLISSREQAMMMVEAIGLLRWLEHQEERIPRNTASSTEKRGHDTEDYYQLKDEIERLIWQGYFREIVYEGGSRDRRSPSRSRAGSSSKEKLELDKTMGGRRFR
ncbi:UNVERIFIED_CONTAM: hypothetical protein Sindi_2455000 [Sesamum indicum]